MLLSELISAARYRADDRVAPYLWSSAEWIEYANDAEREACRRARLITDSTTAAICQLTLVNATETYALDSRIQFIKRVKISSSTIPLKPASMLDLDEQRPGWQDETGDPQLYVTDMDQALFRPYPTPTAAATVTMTVLRDPLVDMEDGDDTPEIASRYHLGLVHWMMFRAYSKEDTQTYSPKAADRAAALFEAEFGPKSSAQNEAWIRTHHGFMQDEGVY